MGGSVTKANLNKDRIGYKYNAKLRKHCHPFVNAVAPNALACIGSQKAFDVVSKLDPKNNTLSIFVVSPYQDAFRDKFVKCTVIKIDPSAKDPVHMAETGHVTDAAGVRDGKSTTFGGTWDANEKTADLLSTSKGIARLILDNTPHQAEDMRTTYPKAMHNGSYTNSHSKIALRLIQWLKEVSRSIEDPEDETKVIRKPLKQPAARGSKAYPGQERLDRAFDNAMTMIKKHIEVLKHLKSDEAKEVLKSYKDLEKSFRLREKKKASEVDTMTKGATAISIIKGSKDISFSASPEQNRKLEKLNKAINELGYSKRDQDIKKLHESVLQLLKACSSKKRKALLTAYLSGTAHDLKDKNKKSLFTLITMSSDHSEGLLDGLYASIQRIIREAPSK